MGRRHVCTWCHDCDLGRFVCLDCDAVTDEPAVGARVLVSRVYKRGCRVCDTLQSLAAKEAGTTRESDAGRATDTNALGSRTIGDENHCSDTSAG